jgi:hypothetical protein
LFKIIKHHIFEDVRLLNKSIEVWGEMKIFVEGHKLRLFGAFCNAEVLV